MQDFKHLLIWKRSYALAIAVHHVARDFGRAGQAGLRGQLTRAADSIPTNIVEGCGSATPRELSRYLDIAIKSANETEHHLLFARDLGLLSLDEWTEFTDEVVAVRKMIFGYRRRILERTTTRRT